MRNIFNHKKIPIKIIFVIFALLIFFISFYAIFFLWHKDKIQEPIIFQGSTFTIEIPDGWHVATSSVYKDFTVISEDEKTRATRDVFLSDKPIVFVTTKNVATRNLEELISELRYRMVPEIFAFSFNNYKLIKEEKINISGLDGYIIENSFEVTRRGKINPQNIQMSGNNNHTYKHISFIAIKNEKMYVMTAFCIEENWEEVKNIFDATLLTFKI